jgi:predicted acetyltransferase
MLQKITDLNSSIFDQLIQAYEEEFASITGKKKNQNGKYSLDSDWKSPNEGFYWLEKGEIVGFCVKGKSKEYSDIFEFYVIPTFRGKGIGEKMAFAVFDAYPGKWQVRQIEGADKAREFWRKTIRNYTSGDFKEIEFIDSYWGPVTCQRFTNKI